MGVNFAYAALESRLRASGRTPRGPSTVTHVKSSILGAALLPALPLVATTASAAAIVNFTTVFGTDFTTAGTGGLRDGTGTVTVAGVTGPVDRSYLFWHGPTNSADANAMANIGVNGDPLVGTNIGFSDNNFWGFRNSQAYRADSTSLINGNGAYTLTGFNVATVTTGNGAGAAVFFNDGNAANNRDVVIFNGNDSNFASDFDTAGWDFTLSGINYTGGQVFLRLFVSDGQNFGADDDGTLRINGSALDVGGLFQGDTLPGESPTGNGNLFDIVSFDISSFLVLGNNSLRITLDDGFSDALSAIAAFIDLPAGAAPPIRMPEPAPVALLALALLAGVATRRARAPK